MIVDILTPTMAAIAAAIITFLLTRSAQLNDRREKRAQLLDDKREARMEKIEASIDRLGDDLYDGFAQLSTAVPAFVFRPRSGRRR